MRLKFTIEAHDDAGNLIFARTEVETTEVTACADVAAAIREKLLRWERDQREFQESQG